MNSICNQRCKPNPGSITASQPERRGPFLRSIDDSSLSVVEWDNMRASDRPKRRMPASRRQALYFARRRVSHCRVGFAHRRGPPTPGDGGQSPPYKNVSSTPAQSISRGFPGQCRMGPVNTVAVGPVSAPTYEDSFLISLTTSFAILKVPGLRF
jgi:hypothetical protein